MKTIRQIALFCCLYMLMPLVLKGQVQATGQQYYDLGDWVRSAESFELEIRERGARSDLYYNLARAYHQQPQLGPAILAYERCLVLEPTHSKAREGLRLARAATRDGLSSGGSIFRSMGDTLAYQLPLAGWIVVALSAFVGWILLMISFARARGRRCKRRSFYLAMGSLGLCLVANAMILHQYHYRSEALHRGVLMRSVVPVYEQPSIGGLPIFVLHEGTSCYLDGEAEDGVQRIVLIDGRQGWIADEAIAPIALN